MYLSVITDELHVDVKEALPIIKGWGCTHVDFRGMINGKSIEYQTEEELKELKQLCDSLELKVGVLQSTLCKVNLPDEAAQKEEMEKLEGLIRASGILDCKQVRAFNYWQHEQDDPEYGTLGTNAFALKKVVEMMEPIIARAREAGLVLSFENCGQSVDDVIALLNAIQVPGWGLAFDIVNEIALQEETPDYAVEYYVKGLEVTNIVHVKARSVIDDVDIPDKVVLPWKRLLFGAISTGRDVPICVETDNSEHSPLTDEKATFETYRRLYNCWPSSPPSEIRKCVTPPKTFSRPYEDNPVRFVVVGLGMGRVRAREIRDTPGCMLYGVVDLNEEKAKSASEEFKVPYSTDINTFLQDPAVEVMYVVVPTGLHAVICEQCLKAGKNVLTTKPLDVNVENCQRLLDCAKKEGKLLGIDFDLRQNEHLLALKKAIDEGYFGRVLYANTTLFARRTHEYYQENGAWRGTWALDGGGAMCNQGVHEVDRLQFLLGMPKRVRARIATQKHNIECEDIGSAEWEYEDDRIVRFFSTTNHPLAFWYMRVELFGTEGAYIFMEGGPEGSSVLYGKDNAWTNKAPYPVERQFRQGSDAYAYALRTGTPLITPAEEGVNSRRLLDAMYESAKNGSIWVEV